MSNCSCDGQSVVRKRIVARRWSKLLPLTLALCAVSQPAARAQQLAEPLITASVEAAAPPADVPHKPAGVDVLTYWYGPFYKTPFVMKPGSSQAADIPRHTIEYSHIGFWSLGSNFADVMVNKSSMAEPASGGGGGAIEAYVILRSNFGLNEVTGTKRFRYGPLRDVSAEFGANLETKNSSYAPSERTIYVGPNLQFAMPRGYLNLGLHFRKEWNHEGILGKSEDYDPDFNLEPTWMLPFSVGKVHFAYTGFAEFNTAKGKDSFGKETVAEFMIRNSVAIDMGALLLHRAQLVDLHGGFWYWHNEYGKPSSDPGAKQMTPMVGLAIHLDGGRAIQRR